MKIVQTAISLNVPEPRLSADFLRRHLGFTTEMEQDDSFVSLKHPAGRPNVIYLRTGLPTFKPAHRAGPAGDGLLLVIVVEGIDAVHDQSSGTVPRSSPLPRPRPGVNGSASTRTPTGSSSSWLSGCDSALDALGQARQAPSDAVLADDVATIAEGIRPGRMSASVSTPSSVSPSPSPSPSVTMASCVRA